MNPAAHYPDQDPLLAQMRALTEEVRGLRRLVLGGRLKYDLHQAAERLGVSTRTVRRRVDDGQLAASREGGRVFVTESAVRDYEDACRRAA